MTEMPTAEFFEPHIGKSCRLGEAPVTLNLVQVERYEHLKPAGSARTPFLVLLSGPKQPVVPEGFHRVAIEDGPSLELYVIPILTPGRDHQHYQIVFN